MIANQDTLRNLKYLAANDNKVPKKFAKKIILKKALFAIKPQTFVISHDISQLSFKISAN